MLKKRGQVWIETVIYTLIGLTIIGILLSIVVPKINQMSDKAIIEQSLNTLNIIDQKISEISITSGNSREIDIFSKKGDFILDGSSGKFYYILKNTPVIYSQPDQTLKRGNANILTTKKGDSYSFIAYLDYSSLNLTYGGENINRTFSVAPAGYNLVIENLGVIGEKINVNVRQV